jgi:hypothetical protein
LLNLFCHSNNKSNIGVIVLATKMYKRTLHGVSQLTSILLTFLTAIEDLRLRPVLQRRDERIHFKFKTNKKQINALHGFVMPTTELQNGGRFSLVSMSELFTPNCC